MKIRCKKTGDGKVEMNKKKYAFAKELRRELESQPLSKLSISDVCRNMISSRQSFYYYFKDIEDCYAYYLKATFEESIAGETLLSDVFNYFEENSKFIKDSTADVASAPVFWDCLMNHICKGLNDTFTKTVSSYTNLSVEEKDVITSFYAAGIERQLSLYLKDSTAYPKNRYITYCKQMLGSVNDIGNVVSRFSHR